MAKSKNLFLSLLIAVFISGIPFLSGCDAGKAFMKQEYCFACDEFPLVFQGKIQEITGNRYIKTLCLEVDLEALFANKAGGEQLKQEVLSKIQVGDFLQIKYEIKKGKFCEPDDESIYTVETITERDSPGVDINGVEASSIIKLE